MIFCCSSISVCTLYIIFLSLPSRLYPDSDTQWLRRCAWTQPFRCRQGRRWCGLPSGCGCRHERRVQRIPCCRAVAPLAAERHVPVLQVAPLAAERERKGGRHPCAVAFGAALPAFVYRRAAASAWYCRRWSRRYMHEYGTKSPVAGTLRAVYGLSCCALSSEV